MSDGYPLIQHLQTAYQDAAVRSLATGEPFTHSSVVEQVTGGTPEGYRALAEELIADQLDNARRALSWPAHLKAQKDFLDAQRRWIEKVDMTASSVFEIAELIGGPAYDVERTTFGEAWSFITGGAA